MSEHKRKRSRSRSPYAHDGHRRRRSPNYDRERGFHHDASRSSLPYNARELTKHDLPIYKPMFGLYLDIQKQLDIEEIAEVELRGRWKSFINKWNRGELAEGWYDPTTLAKAVRAQEDTESRRSNKGPPISGTDTPSWQDGSEEAQRGREAKKENGDEDDDDFGPSLPQSNFHALTRTDVSNTKSGPAVPTLQDLQSREEDVRIAGRAARDHHFKILHQEGKADRKLQKERLEDLVPRAEPGTRDRQLEKKRDVAASNRAFAAANEADVAEVQDSDLMGEDTMSELKKMKKEQERRKTEREIKREEVLRARMAEREERVRHMREKEEKTMSMLREIAKERFGDGNVQGATLRDD